MRDLLVARLGEGAGVEARHSGEVHRCQHAVGVHVAHALVHVEAAGAKLGEGAGVEAPLFARPADRRRHAERRRRALALKDPFVDALLVADHLRHLVEPLGRDMVLVHVRRLDEVVVDADEDHVVHAHGVAPLEETQLMLHIPSAGVPVSQLTMSGFSSFQGVAVSAYESRNASGRSSVTSQVAVRRPSPTSNAQFKPISTSSPSVKYRRRSS